jgi:hypothetical protein
MEEPISLYPFKAQEYPGKMPSYSYFLSKDFVHELHIARDVTLSKTLIDYKDEKIELTLLLGKLSLKPLGDRYAIIGYGSNACPSRLVEKEIFNLPIVKASAKNVDVVYTYEKTHYRDGHAVPATIVKKSNTSVEVWVSFLDEDQLEKMDESEGRNGRYYDLVELKNCLVTLPNGQILSPVYAYVANKKGIALKDEDPIALASVYVDNRKFKEMFEREILEIINNCKKGETINYLDFEVIPLKNQPQKFRNSLFRGIIIDPTVFNDAKRLHSFLESMLSKEYEVCIASDIYYTIEDGKWEELSKILQNWEWNKRKEELIEWHKSPEFRALCKDVIGLVVPCGRILEELSGDERKVLQQVSKVIEPSSPQMVKMAKEFIMTSVVKRFPILSYTKHARWWFVKCKNVMIMEVTDAKNSISKAKRDIKLRIEDSGWKGWIGLFVFGVVVDIALQSVLPPPLGILLEYASGGSFIIGVIANGKKIKDRH